MQKSILYKIIIPLLFILAVLLGLAQRSSDPYLNGNARRSDSSLKTASVQDELKYYYDKAGDFAAAKNPETTASFLAVGDIMLSRNVANKAKKAGDPLLPFRNMEEIFKSVDFSIGNLESPFSGSSSYNPSGSLVFNAPPENIQGLTAYNFKAVSLANNHALDQGIKGLKNTISYLKENGIQPAGAGSSLAEAWQPAIVEQQGIKICFLAASYSSINDGGKTVNEFVARIEDEKNLEDSLARLKSGCDFIAVMMHAGAEYTRNPNPSQQKFARKAIDLGADMVIGHHPHWIQTLEKYQGKYIFYSLGNFIFDQEWSKDTKEGLALKITLTSRKLANQTTANAATLDDLQGTRIKAELKEIELIPVVIENYSTPRPADEEEKKAIFKKIGQDTGVLR